MITTSSTILRDSMFGATTRKSTSTPWKGISRSSSAVCEVFISIARRKHLHRYLAEFDFRYSNRIAKGIDDSDRAGKLLKGVAGKRLTYQTTNSQIGSGKGPQL